MKRRVEPELMDGAEQALAYSQADFADPHENFVTAFSEHFPSLEPRGTWLDLGCGPGDVMIRFARRYPEVHLHGVDGAEAMLAHGRVAIAASDLADRLTLVHRVLPTQALPLLHYAGLISNSLLHHLHDPAVFWQAVRRFLSPGAPVFVMDLVRPADEAAAQALVDEHAAGEPTILRHDFYHSLLAAFRPDEVEQQLASATLSLAVRQITDRHLIIWGQLPG